MKVAWSDLNNVKEAGAILSEMAPSRFWKRKLQCGAAIRSTIQADAKESDTRSD
jgi:hypothetical protein